MQAKQLLEQSRTNRLRFSLQELLRLVTLLPLSVGFVHVIGLCSYGIWYLIGNDRFVAVIRGIASYFGLVDRAPVLIALHSIPVTLLLGAFIIFVFYLRLPWLKEMALSVILAVPLLAILNFVSLPPFRVTFPHLLLLLRYLVAPLVVSVTLFFVYRILILRLKHECCDQSHKDNPSVQKLVCKAAFVFYLVLSIYGWYDLRSSQEESMKDFQMWQEKAVMDQRIPP